ncbi:MAG: peptidoglycan DD-metalloendopeptidase family protein [Paludibacteraceae bacterium]|nr:peptidoglycan DD-metalloendopeptidase family protein [Paludibacteraceae bacterium]
MKKIFLLILFIVCATIMVAQNVYKGIPEGLNFEIRNDTLFVTSDVDMVMPHHCVFQLADRPNIYRRIYNDETDDLMEDHPANDLYSSVWTRDHVNPYKVKVDSMQDSVRIDLRGFSLPHPGHITSKFGPRRYRYHYGTDLKVQVGDSIRSVFDGKVRIVGWDARGYGHYIVIRHDNGLETVYGHLSSPLVDENMRVYAGEAIGLGGNTGRSTGPHLHFEFRYLGNAFNSEQIIDYEKGMARDSVYLMTKAGTFGYRKAAAVAAQTGAKYVTVRSGDTLSAIARRNGTTVRKICQLNNIKETTILRIGRKLRVQ